MNPPSPVLPDWKWGTPEGSRALDRLLDRRLSFREKLQWLEEAETLALRMQAQGNRATSPEQKKGSPELSP